MTIDADKKSSTEIEREVESTRAGLEDTLGALRDRVQPRAVVDEIWEFASGSGGGDFVKNLGRTARDNPIPVALIGAGIAWLISGRGTPSFGGASRAISRYQDDDDYSYEGYQGRRRRLTAASSYTDDPSDPSYGTPYTRSDFRSEGYEHMGDDEPGVLDKAKQGLKSASDGLSSAASRAADAVSGAASSVSGAVTGAAGAVSGAASRSAGAVSGAGARISGSAQQLSQRAGHYRDQAYRGGTQVTRSAGEFAEQQPLLVAALGLAVGAVVGASFRSTDTERRLMGSQADRLKEQAMELANEGYEKAASVAGQTLDQVKREAEAQGLTTSDAKGAAGTIGDRVRAVYEKGKDTLTSEIEGEKTDDKNATAPKASGGPLPATSSSTTGSDFSNTPKFGA